MYNSYINIYMLQRSRLCHQGANLYRRPHVVAAHTVAIGGWSRSCLPLLCQTNNSIVKSICFATCLSVAIVSASSRSLVSHATVALKPQSLTVSRIGITKGNVGRLVLYDGFIRWSRRFDQQFMYLFMSIEYNASSTPLYMLFWFCPKLNLSNIFINFIKFFYLTKLFSLRSSNS